MRPRSCLSAAFVLSLVPLPSAASSFIHEAQLLAGDAAPGDSFGASVAVSGDTAVVGAPLDDTAAGAEAGSVYVFLRTGTTWALQQQLFASDGGAGDNFGFSVSVAGDTLVVGAWMDDTAAGADAGSAYVFVRSGSTWTEQQKLLPSDGEVGQSFGASVSLSGETAVVGSPMDNTAGGFAAGSAYAFLRSGTVWTEQQKLLAPDGALGDQFGFSASLSGESVIVGAFFDDMLRGSAYVFVRSGTTWSMQQKLLAADGVLNDFFGVSVSLSGDTAVAGAVFADTPAGTDSGAAYVFVRSGTVWTQQQKLIGSDTGGSDLFGVAVSVAGDEVVVGAQDHDTAGGENAGSAYVFGRFGTVWTEHRTLLAPDGGTLDNFGASVSVSGDTVLVGAPFDDTTAGAAAGSAHVFRGVVPVELETFTIE
jgi:hypothetical protein